MDKIHRQKFSGYKQNKLGLALPIHDKNGNQLHVGDKIRAFGYDGIIFWCQDYKCYQMCLSYSKWYGDDEYNADSYGKAYDLRLDDGARMEIELIETY